MRVDDTLLQMLDYTKKAEMNHLVMDGRFRLIFPYTEMVSYRSTLRRIGWADIWTDGIFEFRVILRSEMNDNKL